MNITYEIDENNAVKITDTDSSDTPFLFQPQHPNGTPWESHEQAETWALGFMQHMLDPENNPFPL